MKARRLAHLVPAEQPVEDHGHRAGVAQEHVAAAHEAIVRLGQALLELDEDAQHLPAHGHTSAGGSRPVRNSNSVSDGHRGGHEAHLVAEALVLDEVAADGERVLERGRQVAAGGERAANDVEPPRLQRDAERLLVPRVVVAPLEHAVDHLLEPRVDHDARVAGPLVLLHPQRAVLVDAFGWHRSHGDRGRGCRSART